MPTLFLRMSAASGVLFVVLWFGAFFFSGGFPDLTASQTQLASDYAHNAGRLWAGDHMSRLSVVFLVLFLAGLWLVLQRSEAGTGWLPAVALGSGLLFAGLILLGVLFPAVARELGACAGGAPPASGCDFGRQHVDAYVFSVLYSLTGAVEVLALTPLSVLLGAVAAVVLSKRVLPRWLGWSAAGLAVLALAASVFDVIFPIYLLFAPLGAWDERGPGSLASVIARRSQPAKRLGVRVPGSMGRHPAQSASGRRIRLSPG